MSRVGGRLIEKLQTTSLCVVAACMMILSVRSRVGCLRRTGALAKDRAGLARPEVRASPDAWLTSSPRSVHTKAGPYVDRSTSIVLVGYSLEGVLPMQKITISIFAATLGAALLVSLVAP